MKALILTLISISLFSASSFAIEGLMKSNAKLPFNNEIDASNKHQDKLEQQMSKHYKSNNYKEVAKDISAEEKIVSDFIDVEVHWGGRQDKVVDRRMNSVDAPRVATESQLKVKLINK